MATVAMEADVEFLHACNILCAACTILGRKLAEGDLQIWFQWDLDMKPLIDKVAHSSISTHLYVFNILDSSPVYV